MEHEGARTPVASSECQSILFGHNDSAWSGWLSPGSRYPLSEGPLCVCSGLIRTLCHHRRRRRCRHSSIRSIGWP